MNSVELILLKCIPRGHQNPCSRVGLSCSIFKNTSATCAYPLVSNARKLKRDKRAHACAQGTFSYTPCSRRGLTKNIFFSANIYVPKNICFLKKYIFFKKAYIFFVRRLLVHRRGDQAFHFGKTDFELGVGGKARTRPDILKVVLGPYVQYCPCENSEQKLGRKPKSVLKGI